MAYQWHHVTFALFAMAAAAFPVKAQEQPVHLIQRPLPVSRMPTAETAQGFPCRGIHGLGAPYPLEIVGR